MNTASNTAPAHQLQYFAQRFPHLPAAAENPVRSVKFSQNYNRKLDCKFFTTIRQHSDYWQQGLFYWCILNDRSAQPTQSRHLFRAYLHMQRIVLAKDLPELTAYQDTGMPLNETLELLKSIYCPNGEDFDTLKVSVNLFENVEFWP